MTCQPHERSIFQTFRKLHCVTKSLFFELETLNFGYLLIFYFAELCKVSARLDNIYIRHFIRVPHLNQFFSRRFGRYSFYLEVLTNGISCQICRKKIWSESKYPLMSGPAELWGQWNCVCCNFWRTN